MKSMQQVEQDLKAGEYTLTGVVDAVISVNGIIGVGLITMAEDVARYIRNHPGARARSSPVLITHLDANDLVIVRQYGARHWTSTTAFMAKVLPYDVVREVAKTKTIRHPDLDWELAFQDDEEIGEAFHTVGIVAECLKRGAAQAD